MKVKTRLFFALVVVLLPVIALGIASCRPDSSRNIITATDNGWDSQRLHNAIARLVIENAFYGYELRFSTASSTMNWESLLNGDIDLDIESWVLNVATFPQDLARGDVVVLGVLLPDSRQGLFVPRFVIEGDPARGIAPMAPTLRRIEDLHRYPHVFPDDENPARGRIFGSIPGWMADVELHRQFLYHGLDASFNYVRLGSEMALNLSLAAAYNLGHAWVGYNFEPSWITARMDLIMLENEPFDPVGFLEGRTGFPVQELKIVSNRDFPARFPEINAFLQRFQTGSAVMAQALAHLDETGATHEETAVWLLRNNDELIDKWLPAENAAKLRNHLSQR